ncbi:MULTISPECIES: patatin-like phospholipase family protein [unclassified Nodularia (in: cyanobacteria)]|uniref:patatin-like phospholipase family protein n=1 Tax=unclassified Nodularia (in: cyanobacteria) TaxID=2656917 RepID=UPI00188187F7|nr:MULTISPECIES: patatin-like phospholipase family protein [unclassified Nodularia (in: cyanobacteria)]MBE9200151.1 patatin-like phospholipase family protein [Nodularia sp. LEGE 06071]MCC2694545.1 patatin-like phospholipase family protein [Nodularia sp. LEGE 04288]
MPFRILSLDGGGIRGVIGATMLAAIEKKLNQPLNKSFDLIAGTSTGSILAAGIAAGLTSKEIIEIYKDNGSIIFPYKSRFSLQRLPLLLKYGLSAPKYSDDGLAKVLRDTLGQTKLLDISDPLLLIVAYDTITRESIVFKSWREDPSYGNVPLWEACLCSSSAPTFFPAHKLDKRINGTAQCATGDTITLCEQGSSINNIYNDAQIRITSGAGQGQTRSIKKYEGTKRRALINSPWENIPDHTSSYSIKSIYSAIDGAVAANNPSSCAVAEALRLGHKIEDISVLSIGTGNLTRIIPFEKAQSWGLIQWAQPIISVLLDASSNVNEYITNKIIQERVLRLQFKLDRELTGKPLNDDIDDVSQENINNLIEAAEVYIQQPQMQAALDRFLQYNQ